MLTSVKTPPLTIGHGMLIGPECIQTSNRGKRSARQDRAPSTASKLSTAHSISSNFRFTTERCGTVGYAVSCGKTFIAASLAFVIISLFFVLSSFTSKSAAKRQQTLKIFFLNSQNHKAAM